MVDTDDLRAALENKTLDELKGLARKLRVSTSLNKDPLIQELLKDRDALRRQLLPTWLQQHRNKLTVLGSIVGIVGVVLTLFFGLTGRPSTDVSDVSSAVLDDARKKGAESPHAATATKEEDTLTNHPGIAERNADEATSHRQADQHSARQYVREDSAAAIFASLSGIERGFTARVEELYVGRWVKEGGWKGTVRDLPERTFLLDRWLVKIVEDGNAAEPVLIMAFTTNAETADIRVGDTVVVTGQIRTVSRGGDRLVTLDPATVLPS